jgi:hypothetical protein
MLTAHSGEVKIRGFLRFLLGLTAEARRRRDNAEEKSQRPLRLRG